MQKRKSIHFLLTMPVKAKETLGLSEKLQARWLDEMRQILTPKSVVKKSSQARVVSHIKNCFLAAEKLQTNSLFFLLDSTKMEYVFVSNATQSVLGFTKEEAIKNGFQWLFSLLTSSELEYKQIVVNDFFTFLKELGKEKMMNCTVRYDIVVQRIDGKKVHLLEEVMVSEVSESGDPVLISCFLHDIGDYVKTEHRQCHIYLRQDGELKTIFSKKYQVFEKSEMPLSRRELQILQQFANGLTTQQVAKKLYITENTVKSHRKNILFKLGVKNTTEAVREALSKSWIS